MAKTAEIVRGKPRISKDSVDKLYKIREQELQDRKRYDTPWQDIAAKVNPSMADWNDKPPANSGATPQDYRDIYDNTAIKASVRLADGIQGNAFSRAIPWQRMVLEDEELMERDDAKEWLQRVESHCYRQFAKSSFYDEGRSFVRVDGDFGTAVMFRENDPVRAVPYYQTLHLKRVLIMENRSGEVDTLFRDLWLNPYEAAAFFGEEALPRQIRDALDRVNMKRWLFQQFLFPLENFDLDIGMRETRGMPFYSLYVADVDHSNPIREGGYELKPFFAARWSRNPDGDVWGVDCPGMIEISNVKQANGTRKDLSRIRQLAGRPPLKATENLRGRIRLEPNAITFVRPGEDYAPGFVVGKVESVAEDLKLMQDSINESYYSNLFLTLTRNVEYVKTATEAAGIQGEQAAMLTAFFGRLSTEFLEPAVEDLFQLEMDAGRLPPPPLALRGQELRVDLVSPLAQLQKRYLRLDTTRRWLQELLVIADIQTKTNQPDNVLDNIDFNQYARVTEELYYVDRRVVRDLIDVQRIRAARARDRAAVVQAQLRNETMKAGADVYAAASKAPEAGSPAETIVPAGPRG